MGMARDEIGNGLLFAPKRHFVVVDVPSKEVRDEHVYRRCENLLMCRHGSVACVVDDGTDREEVLLDLPEVALHLPPMVWGTQYNYFEPAVLLVLASRNTTWTTSSAPTAASSPSAAPTTYPDP